MPVVLSSGFPLNIGDTVKLHTRSLGRLHLDYSQLMYITQKPDRLYTVTEQTENGQYIIRTQNRTLDTPIPSELLFHCDCIKNTASLIHDLTIKELAATLQAILANAICKSKFSNIAVVKCLSKRPPEQFLKYTEQIPDCPHNIDLAGTPILTDSVIINRNAPQLSDRPALCRRHVSEHPWQTYCIKQVFSNDRSRKYTLSGAAHEFGTWSAEELIRIQPARNKYQQIIRMTDDDMIQKLPDILRKIAPKNSVPSTSVIEKWLYEHVT